MPLEVVNSERYIVYKCLKEASESSLRSPHSLASGEVFVVISGDDRWKGQLGICISTGNYWQPIGSDAGYQPSGDGVLLKVLEPGDAFSLVVRQR